MFELDSVDIMSQTHKLPLKRAHFVGSSVVVTIDQAHVKRLAIDDMTFFLQKPVDNGIILEVRKFDENPNVKK
jgi:hypothetical protein